MNIKSIRGHIVPILTALSLAVSTACPVQAVDSFAEIMAETFVGGMNENRDEMLSLVDSGTIVLREQSGGKLEGLSFCFTGELVSMKRADAQNLVKENGGSVKSSVVKGLSYLVTNDTTSGSSKNVKAAQLGIPIINEKDFLAMVGPDVGRG